MTFDRIEETINKAPSEVKSPRKNTVQSEAKGNIVKKSERWWLPVKPQELDLAVSLSGIPDEAFVG